MSSDIKNTTDPVLPSPAKPMYPDVPWWSVLITALVCSLAAVGATVLLLRPPAIPGVPSAGLPAGAGLIVDTLVYMPHVLLLFGVLADMFTYDGVWSIPSLIGVMSIFLNFVFRYVWVGIDSFSEKTVETVKKGLDQQGGAKLDYSKSYDGCSVQGFELFASEYAPQTLVITATVFSYYCIDLIQNRGWVNSIAAVVMFLLTYVGQTGILSMASDGGCTREGFEKKGMVAQSLRAMAEGLLFGGTSYGIVKTYYPTRLPSSTISPFPRKSAADLTMGPDGRMVDADGYPYVVLPNGQAMPDFGDKKSRMAFGALVATNLGTGQPATAGCAAK